MRRILNRIIDCPLMRVLCTAVMVMQACLIAGESGFTAHGMTVRIAVSDRGDGSGDIRAVVSPETQPSDLYLYDLATDPTAVGGGLPLRLDIPAASGLVELGPLTADQQPFTKLINAATVSIYAPGSTVTLRRSLRWPEGDGSPRTVMVEVSYMACDAEQHICLPPVQRLVGVRVPTRVVAAATDARIATLNAEVAALRGAVEAAAKAQADINTRLRRQLAELESAKSAAGNGGQGGHGAIAWRSPSSVAAIEALITQAHSEQRAVLLDFTGPSCTNCVVMERTVFVLPAVAQAWNSGVAVRVDTDTFPELGAWQRERFRTEARPLYVRIAPGQPVSASAPMWAGLISPDNAEQVAALRAFLQGSASAASAVGGVNGERGSLWALIAAAVIGGLVTLLMPCTYPMIPFTISFFAKQGSRATLPLALSYGLGLVLCFVGVGVAIVGVPQWLFGTQVTLTQVSGSAWVNLGVALLFVVFGLSMLGLLFLRPPAWLGALAGGSRGGYLGALMMGLVFTITAFTCTAPIAGSVLGVAAIDGGAAWFTAAWVMAIYGATIAVPFTVLALVPGIMGRLPRAGAWMNEVKTIGGIIELAAAWKFLHFCNGMWAWNLDWVFGRTPCLILWSTAMVLIGLYVLGSWRWHDDEPVARTGTARLLVATLCFCLGIWLISGAAGASLGLLEGAFGYGYSQH